ncbi:carbohydrate-binding protein [Paenibacillus psychroresistens]|uniref:Carbohydrate-binding protein n=1 Tax=Paenibacillus psychroresistens TaxID=1778678 RepID=A0A6B8RG67_9BACL|nr:CBM35 domain-containing protein [Paenibacillus psychroresistens]QGQ95451.1 carbohydrate-binding protein [Paenibacillus psychroresistens]
MPTGSTSADIGLDAPAVTTGSLTWACIDDLTLTLITPVKYEAEKAVVINGTTQTSVSASNGKYVSGIANSDSSVTYRVNVPASATYTMNIRYANGTGANSTMNMSVNEGTATAVTFAPTAGWGQFVDKSVSVVLNPGDNLIKLAKGSTGTVELDYIGEFLVSSQALITTRYEAENGTISGATVGTASNASNARYVKTIDLSTSYVQIANINAPTAGTYKLTIGYANGSGSTSTHTMTVNGASGPTVSYPVTAGWGKFGLITVNVALNAGNNTIKLQKGTGFAELDYIEVAQTF